MILIEEMKKLQLTYNDDVINKSHLDEKISKLKGHLSLLEKDYNEIQTFNNKQSVKEVLFQRAVTTTTQILYDKCLFNGFRNAEAA